MRQLAQAKWLLGASVFVLSFVVLALCSNRSIDTYDEGIILTGADRVMHGAWPYRDFYTDYGPAQFVIVAGFFKVFGASVFIERVWDTLIRAAIVLLSFLIGRQVATLAYALAIAAASLAWLASFWLGYGYPLFPAMAAAMAALVLLCGSPCGIASGRIAAAGVCIGVAMLFRYDVGVSCLIAACAGFGAAGWLGSAKGTWRSCAALLCGCGSVAVPILVALTWAGALPYLVFDVVAFPAAFYASTRSLPFPSLSAMWADRLACSVYLPPAVLCCCAPWVIGIVRNRALQPDRFTSSADSRRASQATLLILFAGVGFAKGIVRVSPLHMAMAYILSLLLLALIMHSETPYLGGLARWVCCTCAAGVVVLTWFASAAALGRAAQNIAWAREAIWTRGDPSSGTCHMPSGLERLACFPVSAARIAAIAYVQHRTQAGDVIFVGLPHHDRIIANDISFYFDSARTPATKWYHFDPGLQTSGRIQARMMEELRLNPPKLLVIEDAWQDFSEPNASSVSSHETLLDDYLSRDFEPAVTFGTYRISTPNRRYEEGRAGGSDHSP